MPAPGPVRAGVWDVSGRLVRTLHDGTLRAGIQDLTWDGCGPDGRPVAAGIYWIRIDGSTESTAQRLLVLK
jgi:flagellar hook assembly protein FlgD